MNSGPYQRPEPMLTLAQAAEALGQDQEAVLADAANGSLTWAVIDGETLYPEATVRALAARRAPRPDDDPLISRAEASRILGVGPSGVYRLVPRDPSPVGSRSYRLSAVMTVKAGRDGKRRTLSPERVAALHAGRDAAQGRAAEGDGPLTAQELARAQAAFRARQARP